VKDNSQKQKRKGESSKHVLPRILEDYIFQLARSTGPAPLSRMAGWGGEEGAFLYRIPRGRHRPEAQPTDRSYIMQVSPHHSRALIIYSIPA
jgi:hypothetical protein